MYCASMVPGCLLITLLGRGCTPFGGGPEFGRDMFSDTFVSLQGSAVNRDNFLINQNNYAIKMRYITKVSDPIFFFCKNLVDFNEACFHEATLNLHMHVLIFSCLSIVSVDGKQPLCEVVFSAPIRFSL